jgi:hypothetical protein
MARTVTKKPAKLAEKTVKDGGSGGSQMVI